MAETFRVPFQSSETEFTEKRSRFIGHLLPVKTEEQAREFIGQMKKKYYDARHNCWCYLIGDSVVRYSDDGEPQGTAGQPMLNVFQRREVWNVCCVVTRYFGGILLGAGATGGLIMADGRLTTQTALAREKRILRIERDGRGQVAPILPEDAADKTLHWTSSDEGVATIDDNGIITALAPGQAVAFYVGDRVLGSATITTTT